MCHCLSTHWDIGHCSKTKSVSHTWTANRTWFQVKLSLCFNWAPCHESVWGSGGIAPCILYLGTRWRWVADFTSWPDRFTPRERAPCTHWIGGWEGPRAGLDAVVKREIPSPCRDSNPWSSIPQRSAIPPEFTRAVWKARGLAAVRRCYAEGGGDLCQVVVAGDKVVVAWSLSL
jgi:hypothetical protein